MKNNTIKQIIAIIAVSLWITDLLAQEPADSLTRYLEQAARNNPRIHSDFMLYKAAMEKIPQAGAYPDPELEIGLFVKPMETLMGKQVADFTLMQMFPWFGTRRAARGEATEMARMAYEKFRDSRNTLWYDVKAQWYLLCNLNEQYKTTEANIALLRQLEQLALNRFSASPAQGGTPVSGISSGTTSETSGSAVLSNGMSGMAGMTAAKSAAPATGSMPASGSGMSGMGNSPMRSATGGMSDVLRIQMERAELENDLENLHSARTVAEAQFNTLLNRPSATPVTVPDSLEQRFFLMDGKALTDSLFSNNPMITMIEAEAEAYRAKAKMDRRMSYPMIGVGLQYSLFNKTGHPVGMPDMNGKDMVMPMVKLSLPLFRRKYNAQQRESRYYWKSSEYKRENVKNELEAEYISFRRQLEDAGRKVDLYTRQYALSLSTWQLIVREFSAGRQSLTDVIQVERQMLDYKLRKSEAVAAYNTGVAGLEKLVSISLNTDDK